MFTSNTVLIRRHYKFLVYFAMAYFTTNFLATKHAGKPLYGFLTWEDYRTPLITVAMTATLSFLFIFIAMIDERITGRTAEKPKKTIDNLD